MFKDRSHGLLIQFSHRKPEHVDVLRKDDVHDELREPDPVVGQRELELGLKEARGRGAEVQDQDGGRGAVVEKKPKVTHNFHKTL